MKGHIIPFHFHEIFRIGKSREAESRLVVSRSWKERRMTGRGGENALELGRFKDTIVDQRTSTWQLLFCQLIVRTVQVSQDHTCGR